MLRYISSFNQSQLIGKDIQKHQFDTVTVNRSANKNLEKLFLETVHSAPQNNTNKN